MLPYWVLLAGGGLLAFSWTSDDRRRWAYSAALVGAVILVLFIGLRFRIGADWDNYDFMFIDSQQSSAREALITGDPGYSVISWVIARLRGQVWHVNIFCAIIFVTGLLRLCETLPLPGVGVLAAIPTLVIVVAMGYTRQGAAIGCLMWAIYAFRARIEVKWVAWLIAGVLLHKSAIFALPIFALAAARNRIVSLAIAGGIGLVMLSTLILNNLDALLFIYIEGDLQSSGALVRLVLALLPAVLFLFMPHREQLLGDRAKLWAYMAYATLALIPAFLLVRSSTAIDRIALLFIPLQLAFFSAAPLAFFRSAMKRQIAVGIIVLYCAALMSVWLLLADHKEAWVPYRNVLSEPYLF